MCVLDTENTTPLSGFNGSTQWTEGNGYLPVTMQDKDSGKTFKLDINDCDHMTKNLSCRILSLGKLLRQGWDFHFSKNGNSCQATTPGGAHTVNIELGIDNLLRMDHNYRTGADKAPIPIQP